jgi:hypothetical protein
MFMEKWGRTLVNVPFVLSDAASLHFKGSICSAMCASAVKGDGNQSQIMATLDCVEEIPFCDIDVNWFDSSLLCLGECNFNKGSEILVLLIRGLANRR